MLSGFAYSSIWNETWPPPIHMSGVGHLEIPLPEGYQAKNWKIQLRWPHPMKSVTCFTDTVKASDCDGAGQASYLKVKLLENTADIISDIEKPQQRLSRNASFCNTTFLGCKRNQTWH